MREMIRSAQFKRASGKAWQGHDKLRDLILLLAGETPLPALYKDHPLSGEWKHHRDSHIESDWLSLYKIDGNDLYLIRTGTHADLF
jgi:mRNA interferase YafQ